ncbi:MAG: hypothetical protein NVSMB9_06130 [Isosphaeraceae bacterium]
MNGVCSECGAAIPEGGSCRDHFHALLGLEWEVPGGPGEMPHFFAVACYGLQHPESMNYTADTLAALHTALADVLDGRATLDEVRRRTRRSLNGAARVTRREGEAVIPWRTGSWPMTVADVLTVEPEVNAYAERVSLWARSVRAALDIEGSVPDG